MVHWAAFHCSTFDYFLKHCPVYIKWEMFRQKQQTKVLLNVKHILVIIKSYQILYSWRLLSSELCQFNFINFLWIQTGNIPWMQSWCKSPVVLVLFQWFNLQERLHIIVISYMFNQDFQYHHVEHARQLLACVEAWSGTPLIPDFYVHRL